MGEATEDEINIKISPSVASPPYKKNYHILPFLGLVCDFVVLTERSGTLLNFSPSFTFHM
jgi:hypothetical protein